MAMHSAFQVYFLSFLVTAALRVVERGSDPDTTNLQPLRSHP
jgi:hypothetical protein